jgi:hypothetical protein
MTRALMPALHCTAPVRTIGVAAGGAIATADPPS